MAVLVLNASYEPLNVVTVQRAIILLLKDKAQLVEAAEALWRSEHQSVPVPLVIRLLAYVRLPHCGSCLYSRRGVLARDEYTCQYCGAMPGRQSLTIDHLVPRSRGGGRTWLNLVAACAPCNRRKGEAPAEAGLRLLREPFVPRILALALVEPGPQQDRWAKYLAGS